MAEDDLDGWKNITKSLGNKVQLVGDDLFVTNVEKLKEGIENNIANSILIKLNQIGTVTETIEAVGLAYENKYYFKNWFFNFLLLIIMIYFFIIITGFFFSFLRF